MNWINLHCGCCPGIEGCFLASVTCGLYHRDARSIAPTPSHENQNVFRYCHICPGLRTTAIKHNQIHFFLPYSSSSSRYGSLTFHQIIHSGPLLSKALQKVCEWIGNRQYTELGWWLHWGQHLRRFLVTWMSILLTRRVRELFTNCRTLSAHLGFLPTWTGHEGVFL